MSRRPLVCVIDANVALKLFFEQSGSERADALFAHLDSDARARFYVPDFFYAECATAFATYARLTGYTAQEARDDMSALHALALNTVATADLVVEALEIALRHAVSGYDACYVALANWLGAPLITADEKLVRALAGKPFLIQSLVSFNIPTLS
jgi:predicted nucleic acid-binding protein